MTDICNGVGINRSSFYAHYSDVHDIAQSLALSIQDSLSEKFRQNSLTEDSIGTKESLLIVLNHVKENRDFYQFYFSYENLENVHNHFSHIFNESISPFLDKQGVQDVKEQHYHFLFFNAGLISVLKEWLKDGCVESPDLISDIVLRTKLF